MDLHPDFKELLAECVAAKVDFAIVDGYAVGFHGRPRATKDLDLLVVGASRTWKSWRPRNDRDSPAKDVVDSQVAPCPGGALL